MSHCESTVNQSDLFVVNRTDVDYLMLDHPAWQRTGATRSRVFTVPGGQRVLVTATNAGFHAAYIPDDGARPEPSAEATVAAAPLRTIVAMSSRTCAEIPLLKKSLAGLGTVARFRTTDLWEALVCRLIGQSQHPRTTRHLVTRLCDTYGERIETPAGEIGIMPTADAVLELPSRAFRTVGLAQNYTMLIGVAEQYLRHRGTWNRMSPAKLIPALRDVPRVGESTARAIVADYTGDYTHYPYGDSTIRAWASRISPGHPWPTDPARFRQLWRRLAPTDTGALTLLTLAWGEKHAAQWK